MERQMNQMKQQIMRHKEAAQCQAAGKVAAQCQAALEQAANNEGGIVELLE